MTTETKVAEDPQAQVAEPEGDAEPTAEAGETEKTKQKAEPETLSFKTQVELDAHIEKESRRRAESFADKRLTGWQKQVEDLKTELKTARQEEADKKEDSALARIEERQKEVYREEDELPDFQEAQRELLRRARDLREKEKSHDKLTQNLIEQQAFTEALKVYLVPEDAEELFAAVKALAGRLAKAGSDEARSLMVALEEEKLKRQAEAVPNTRDAKPDGGLGSAPGGKTFSADTPKETISEGIRRLKVT